MFVGLTFPLPRQTLRKEASSRSSLRRIIWLIAAENTVMKRVSEEVGFDLHFDKVEDEWKAELVLSEV